MTPTLRRLLPAVAAVLALAAAACDGLPPPPPKAPPVPERVAMASDSIGFQALYYGGPNTAAGATTCDPAPAVGGWDWCGKIGLGWRASHAQARTTADVANPATSPATLVVEFGHNYGKGFTAAYRNEVTQFVFTPAADTCEVLVVPYSAPQLNATHRQALADYTAHITELARVRPNTVLARWDLAAAANPHWLDTDGIHLATPYTTPAQDLQAAAEGEASYTDPGAAQGFLAVLAEGVAACA